MYKSNTSQSCLHNLIITELLQTNSAEACHYVANHSRVNIIVVDNDIQLQKILAIKHKERVLCNNLLILNAT